VASSRLPLMAGNWKMNLNHFEAIATVQKLGFSLTDDDLKACEVAVLPPFTDIRSVQTLVDGDKLDIRYGAQDVSVHDDGAYTGEISAAMLGKLGCSYVVVGHSERREHHAETDEVVNAKAHKSLAAGMTPIVCVGEGLEVRQAGEHVPHTMAQVEGYAPKGARVALIEDVSTTGTQVLAAARAIEECEAKVAVIVLALDRGGANALTEAGYPVRSVVSLRPDA